MSFHFVLLVYAADSVLKRVVFTCISVFLRVFLVPCWEKMSLPFKEVMLEKEGPDLSAGKNWLPVSQMLLKTTVDRVFPKFLHGGSQAKNSPCKPQVVLFNACSGIDHILKKISNHIKSKQRLETRYSVQLQQNSL